MTSSNLSMSVAAPHLETYLPRKIYHKSQKERERETLCQLDGTDWESGAPFAVLRDA